MHQKGLTMSPNHRKPPDTASVAIPDENGKLHAPSAARNVGAIVQAISAFVPDGGNALEIASGTGQHVVRYAEAFPNIVWQPTDIDPNRLKSIAVWTLESSVPNVLKPEILNATSDNWSTDWSGKNLIILSNLLHLISEREVLNVISQSAKALASGGVSLIYGPFLRGSAFASDSDRNFHQSLKNKDHEIGYKSYQYVQVAQTENGLITLEPIPMPSANLLLVARKP